MQMCVPTVSTVIFRHDSLFVVNMGVSTGVLGECHCKCFLKNLAGQ